MSKNEFNLNTTIPTAPAITAAAEPILHDDFDLGRKYHIRMDRIMMDGSLLVSPTLTNVKKSENLLEIWSQSAPNYHPNREYETLLVRIWTNEAEVQFKMQFTRQHHSMGLYVRFLARHHDLSVRKALDLQDVDKLIRLEAKIELLRKLLEGLQIVHRN